MATPSTLEVDVEALTQQFKNVDNRPLQTLGKVITVEELRRQRLSADAGRPSSISLDLRTKKASDQDKPFKARTQPSVSAYGAAKEQVRTRQPALYDRIGKTLDYLQVSRENRKHRLNSLGVFSPEINEVRCRSMYRVELQQELSTKALRVPQKLKDIKPLYQDMSIAARLERLYMRVIRSIDDVPISRPRALRIAPRMSFADRAEMSMGAHGLHRRQSIVHPPPDHGLALSPSPSRPERPQQQDWRRRVMSPQAAQAHLERTMAATQTNLQRYHEEVAGAQQRLMNTSGLTGRLSLLTPEELVKELEKQNGLARSSSFSHDSVSKLITSVMDLIASAEQGLASHPTQHHTLSAASASLDAAPMPPLARRNTETGAAATDGSSSVGSDEDEGDRGENERVMHNSPGSRVDAGRGVMAERSTRDGDDRSVRDGGSVQPARPSSGSQAGLDDLGDDREMESSWRSSTQQQQHEAPAPAPVILPGLRRIMSAMSAAQTHHSRPASEETTSSPSSPIPSHPATPPGPEEILPPLGSRLTGTSAVHARLQRIWDVLEVPGPMQLDMVMAVTDRSRALLVYNVLEAWEHAAVAVLVREEALGKLVEVRRRVLALQEVDDATLKPRGGLKRSVSLEEVEQVCVEFLEAGAAVNEAANVLRTVAGAELTVMGDPYPGPDAFGQDDVLEFLAVLKDLLTSSANAGSIHVH